MKISYKKKYSFLAGCVLLFVTSMRAQRACLNLSETLWNITLDRSAVWQNDSLLCSSCQYS